MNYSDKRRALKESKRHHKKFSEKMEWVSLGEAVEKRFKTVFVGALSKVEESFGLLWGGDDIDEENMTPEQLKWYEIFLKLRDDIFDQGNDQKKKCINDLDRCKARINILVSNPKEEHDG